MFYLCIFIYLFKQNLLLSLILLWLFFSFLVWKVGRVKQWRNIKVLSFKWKSVHCNCSTGAEYTDDGYDDLAVCSCAVMERNFLQMAECAYKRIRRRDSSSSDFERFRNELAQTNDILRQSMALIKHIREICNHQQRLCCKNQWTDRTSKQTKRFIKDKTVADKTDSGAAMDIPLFRTTFSENSNTLLITHL